MSKDDPVYDLEKIPDQVIISSLRVKVGKLEAYIEELEYENGKNIKLATLKDQANRINNLEKKLKLYEDKANENIAPLKESIEFWKIRNEHLVKVLANKNRQINVLQADLYKQLKNNLNK